MESAFVSDTAEVDVVLVLFWVTTTFAAEMPWYTGVAPAGVNPAHTNAANTIAKDLAGRFRGGRARRSRVGPQIIEW